MPHPNVTTEVPTDGCWKFVKVNGEYRWTSHVGHHVDCVDDGETAETAEAAGGISIFPPLGFRWASNYSTSLKIGSTAEHCEEVKALLGMEELPDF